jgi:hypothetical protein
LSLIVPRPTFLRILDGLRWSRLAWGSLALGGAFAAGALYAGILAKPPADVPLPVAMVPETAPAPNLAPMRSGKIVAMKRAKALPGEAGARRETIGLAAIEASATILAIAPAATGEGRAQDQTLAQSPASQTSASTTGQTPRIAIDTEANEPLAQDTEAAPKAAKESSRAKRIAKYSHWRMVRAQLDAYGSQWAYADRQTGFGPQSRRRGFAEPSSFWFGR